MAANQAEAELLQGVLTDAGIPSNWRRTGGDLPELLGVLTEEPMLGLVALAVLLVAGAAILIWSERAARG